ncbi:hypothetical protein [Vibrio splendidus]|uniref:hypothetical protein n=1 Tax=Vibrio splendidus TaxID=29497 RepID=UPI0012DB3B9C|nr:hypothetical protein [Vibrio splendidus]
MSKPTADVRIFSKLCISGVGDKNKKTRLYNYINHIIFESKLYEDNSCRNELYKTVKRFELIKKQPTVDYVSKSDLKDIYTYQMAKKDRPGRKLYDALMKVPLNKRCPFCSVGRVKNLDHFLPKSPLPIFSILPINLVPSCRDCNQDKSDGLSTKERDQTLHPYFDDVSYVQWLYARLIKGNPIVIDYYLEPTMLEDESLELKVQAHFEAYDLADIFSEMAAEELNQIYFESRRIFLECGCFELKNHLVQKKESFLKNYKNSWQVALYQSLAQSEWYCSGKFITDAPKKDRNKIIINNSEENECHVCRGKVTFDCPNCVTSKSECTLCGGSRFLTSSNCPNCKGSNLGNM